MLLTGLAAIAVIIAVHWPWFSKIGGYWIEFGEQVAIDDIDVRKAERYGSAYTRSKDIALMLQKRGQTSDALILLPPASYFKAKGITYRVPEPAVFYYFTGLRSVRPDTKDTAAISHVVTVRDHMIDVKRIADRRELRGILAEYRKYKITL